MTPDLDLDALEPLEQEATKALREKLAMHSGGCGVHFDYDCSCLSRESKIELKALIRAARERDALLLALMKIHELASYSNNGWEDEMLQVREIAHAALKGTP